MAVTLGEFSFTRLFFRSPLHIKEYVVGLMDVQFLDWLKMPESNQAERVHHANMDDGMCPKFFLCWVNDCMSPPMAVVRAESVEDAIDRFVEEFAWAQASQEEEALWNNPNARDEEIGCTGQGVLYNTQTMECREVFLFRAEV